MVLADIFGNGIIDRDDYFVLKLFCDDESRCPYRTVADNRKDIVDIDYFMGKEVVKILPEYSKKLNMPYFKIKIK